MAIYQLNGHGITPVPSATFAQLGISERGDLQRLLRDRIAIVSPDTLVISEEFGDWEDSRRRIDLLGIDKDANLVVIELKRTEDGGHMELQAVRYAAMVSTLTFDRVVEIFERYLESRHDDIDARQSILNFLGWDEPVEEQFASDVRIVLASAEFSRELTTAVLWLADHGIDVRCVRIRPHGQPDNILIDVQQLIPLPEAEDYQVRVRERRLHERAARAAENARYEVHLGSDVKTDLPRNRAVLAIVQHLARNGYSPEKMQELITWRPSFMKVVDVVLSGTELRQTLSKADPDFSQRSWFTEDGEVIHSNGKTYCLVARAWGRRGEECMRQLIDASGIEGVSFRRVQ